MKPEPVPGSSQEAMQTERAEPELVERAQRGDQAAFRGLVERHRDRAYATALRITGTPADAEEATQDAFVRVWRALPGFRGDARFTTWLFRIVVRTAIDRRRALAERRSREVGVEAAGAVEALEAVGAQGDPAGGPGGPGGSGRFLLRLMEQLSDVQRGVVTLYYLEDRPVAEVAALLDLPENTVKTHLSRARAILREAWERAERKESLT
ncbi:MAG: RNA polymerase sigma factor [Candidatus Eiseniibacteriota bacterium]